MYLVTLTYGHPDDPAAFDAHYQDQHLALTAQIPHVQTFAAGRCEEPSGGAPASYMTATLTFPDRDAAMAALSSPQGQAAAADLQDFATGGAAMTFTDCSVVRH